MRYECTEDHLSTTLMNIQLNNSIWLIICVTFVNLLKLALITFDDLATFYSGRPIFNFYFYSSSILRMQCLFSRPSCTVNRCRLFSR